ncbi:MAG: hypothetical protein IPK84_03530 [Candidatus Moraniibacteriota bacterium]|nr:MAG: hypothetical protein IPK84_03530 [Candidatus Moranbacteria bacterium]
MKKIPSTLERVLAEVELGNVQTEQALVDFNPNGIPINYLLYFCELPDGTVVYFGRESIFKDRRLILREDFLAVGKNKQRVKDGLKYPTLRSPTFLKEGFDDVEMIEPLAYEVLPREQHADALEYNKVLQQTLERLYRALTLND